MDTPAVTSAPTSSHSGSARKTLVFCISSYKGINTGVGGHYRSVREIAGMLQSAFDVHVVTFGDLPSPVFAGQRYYRHIPVGSVLAPYTWYRLRQARNSLGTGAASDVLYITVGDLSAYIPILLCMGLGSGPVAHVKPGGPSFPRSYIYNTIPLMVFHKQDYALFESHDNRRPLMMAPGRVSTPPYDPDYLGKAVPRFLEVRGSRLRLLTVCRIAGEKEQSIRLMYGALENVGSDLVSIHIGIPQSPELLQSLGRTSLSFEHHFAVTDEAVDTAARAIHECELFIGLGRSVIEAMALGKIPFVPVVDGNGNPRLVAVTGTNWRTFEDYNFTNRVPFAALEQAGPTVFLEEVAKHYQKWSFLGNELQEVYENHLSVRNSAVIWRRFCEEALDHKTSGKMDVARVLYFLLFIVKRKLDALKRRDFLKNEA